MDSQGVDAEFVESGGPGVGAQYYIFPDSVNLFEREILEDVRRGWDVTVTMRPLRYRDRLAGAGKFIGWVSRPNPVCGHRARKAHKRREGNSHDIGEIIVVHMAPDRSTPYHCYLSGPVVEVRPDGLLVVEPTQYKPMPEDWRPYDGVKRVLARDLGEQRNAPRFSYAGNDATLQ